MKTTTKIGLLTLVISLIGSPHLFADSPKVMIDPVDKKIIVLSGEQKFDIDHLPPTSGSVGTESDLPKTEIPLDKDTPSSAEKSEIPSTLTAELAGGTEIEKALYRMHLNGLTKYDTLDEYRPDDPLSREEAAKIIGQAYLILGFEQKIKEENCAFTDAELFDESLAPFITKTCGFGIFKGNKGKFMPHRALSKAEALTVLVRIIEGKESSEAFDPRRTLYFTKAKGISITNETQVNSLDRAITRREIALLIYRFKTLMLNQKLKQAAKTQLGIIDTNPESFLTNGTGNTEPTPASNPTTGETRTDYSDFFSGVNQNDSHSLSILNNPELQEAIQRMRDRGLTNAKDITSYQPFDILTREQAAKMFVQFAKSIEAGAISGTHQQCNFIDQKLINPDLKAAVQNACQLGIMQGSNKVFGPQIVLTKAEFITILIRLSEGKHLDETTNPRRKNYFLKAKAYGILNNEDVFSFEEPLTRYEAALLFYRFQIKQKITSHLNTEILKNELLSTKRGENGNFASGDIANSYAVALNSNLLKNQYFQEGFVELLGTRYRLKKTNTTVFDIGEESFVRYGDLIDMQQDTKIGTTNFVVSNGNIVQGTIRLSNENTTWIIKESKTTTAWFNAIKM